MLYGTPALEPVDQAVLGEIEEMRRQLKYRLAEPHRWDRQLRRQIQARAIQGSNSIEGYNASVEDIESIMSGEEPLDTPEPVAREIAGYRQAMTYIRALSRAPGFRFDLGVLNSLNFMMIGHHHGKDPGVLRPGGIYVRDSSTRQVVYEGPEAGEVPALMGALVEWLNQGDLSVSGYVRGAMAHLNLVKIHPWRDGNGRMSRALQSLVLGRDQITAPEFASIEEWLGKPEVTSAYYRMLGTVGRARWSPHDDTMLWVRFCLRAHHMQAQSVLGRLQDAAEVWALFESLTGEEGLDPRCVSALYQVFVSRRLRRGTYQADEGLSQGQAARDLRDLSAKGWLKPYGATKGRFYAPGPKVEAVKADFARKADPLLDPYLGSLELELITHSLLQRSS
ncbi:Fic family protein [Sinosporangium siamense]|uniref:Cell division protein Fic n=1 Tax=Sinosporangium siamense TaxID=1367973 RepID=A0A919RH40_9ACTN|nr:Fic family protein [Sinosporangium siamense]GII93733.1 cell division protein Fic [Sinosporangium siamense]